MALVDYSDSEEEDHQSNGRDASKPDDKRAKDPQSTLPPLPSKFHDLYSSNVRVSVRDDPSLHDGRKRSSPHIQGNWPSHLYIEWYPTPAESAKISLLISSLQARVPNINSFLVSGLGAPLPLHISLSRSLGLLTAQKDAFLETITRSIHRSNIRPFQVEFKSIDWVSNFENTRWFLVIRLETPPLNELKRMLGLCNKVAKEYGQPALYQSPISADPGTSPPAKRLKMENPHQSTATQKENRKPVPAAEDEKFHVSIAWTLTPPDKDALDITKAIAEIRLPEVKSLHIDVKEMKVKIGNIITTVALPEKAKIERGLFG